MKKIKLFANCIPVRGVNRSIICDIQRENFVFIPIILHDILEEFDECSIKDIKNKFDLQYHIYIDDYIKLLTDNEFIFYTDKPKMFPKIDYTWDIPYTITNAIIDISNLQYYQYEKIVQELDNMGCMAVQIRTFSYWTIPKIKRFLKFFDNKRIISIELILKHSQKIKDNDYIELLEQNKRVSSLLVHSSPKSEIIKIPSNNYGYIISSSQEINNKEHCGLINIQNFATNYELFIEAQKHNTCLNRKISIDTEGYIRNCPSMPEHYGNIKDTTLQEAMQHPDFKKYWFINKDQIEVCKDCEFRYICTDCRAYREDPENLLSKPLKCGYNPYTCEWEEWSTNPLKQKAIDYYGMREMVSKTEQLS